MENCGPVAGRKRQLINTILVLKYSQLNCGCSEGGEIEIGLIGTLPDDVKVTS